MMRRIAYPNPPSEGLVTCPAGIILDCRNVEKDDYQTAWEVCEAIRRGAPFCHCGAITSLCACSLCMG